MAATPTATNVRVTYAYTKEVRCRGMLIGAPCGKVIAMDLHGSVELKCRHCGHIETYRNEGRDYESNTQT